MDQKSAVEFLAARPPYDALSPRAAELFRRALRHRSLAPGAEIYGPGAAREGLYVVLAGEVELRDAGGAPLARLGPGDAFGERGLGEGDATARAVATGATELALLPADALRDLLEREPAFAGFFGRAGNGRRRAFAEGAAADLTLLPIGEIMTPDPVTLPAEATAAEAAALMDGRGISCVLVTEGGRLAGIITTSDLTSRVLARGLGGEVPLGRVMTPRPRTIGPEALGHDAFLAMIEHGIGHFPVVREGELVGIVTRTNLLRRQSLSPGLLIAEIAHAAGPDDLPPLVARIPQLLAQLVSAGGRPERVTRLVTDIADATTRRLLGLAEAELGPPPIPYLWLACGSQGRQEQTGISDQDNCLILDDAVLPEHEPYFAALAKFVSDGLARCGYYYCPGEMMATNPRWRQPLRVWRDYFAGWIRTPDPMAQMLSSVMFDLRPISGTEALFHGLQGETLESARANSIFLAHLISNALKHTPPLSLFGGLSVIRSGEHKNRLDLKLSGVVPVVDLGRIYAIEAALTQANTRARLEGAREARIISGSGAHDLIDAYDLIAEMRLNHQARQVREGEKPDNFMDPATLSELERSHLRDAFVVIRTMQSALSQGRRIG
ncbi:MAG TPA: DUF294 nucleotidyltransferase-like domain-containing protein [Paracoccaceae bacterium]|nr:DUF294 nucleotidyltransferase-like domain-containing protein [Paracoccaceae bacterium]